CGEEVKDLILARDARLPRRTTLQLAKMPADQQQRIARKLLETGELPRPLLPAAKAARKLLAMPAEPRAMAWAVFAKLGRERAEALQEALAAVLRGEDPGAEPEPPPKRGRPKKPR